MVEPVEIKFENLDSADLILDAVYESGQNGFAGSPLPKILGVGNQAGFRKYTETNAPSGYSYIVLHSGLDAPEWPDHIETETGNFIYYGDNRSPGSALHNTDKGGNKDLRDHFAKLSEGERRQIPPYFVFMSTGSSRNQQFRGLAVPGTEQGSEESDLVAIWKSKDGQRFQNYKARFSILDIDRISRDWIEDLQEGTPMTENAPEAWRKWVKDGVYDTIEADPIDIRSSSQQEPDNDQEREVLETVYNFFNEDPTDFEDAAVKLFEMADNHVTSSTVTRDTRDGGRDAVGKYLVGPELGESDDRLDLDFALEAKCHKPHSSCGVRDTMRLISRIRENQFGVFVTTAKVAPQAYEEIRKDDHPVLILSGGDIAKILIQNDKNSREDVKEWLEAEF